VRIDPSKLPDGEARLSRYIKAGSWKYVICDSYDEAHDFQWYAIETLDPILNSTRKVWNKAREFRYGELLDQLTSSAGCQAQNLRKVSPAPGVYLFIHTEHPGTTPNRS